MTKNFPTTELQCPCCGKCEVTQPSADRLQRMRDYYGKPIRVNSAYRCENHNKKVGGASQSKHLEGIAFDLRCLPEQRYEMVEAAFVVGFTCIIVYPSWIHVDDRPGQKMFLIKV